MASGILAGKRGIVFGVANKRSLAWAMTQSITAQGGETLLTYQTERLRENVEELAASAKLPAPLPCDATQPAEVAAVFAAVEQKWGYLDFLIHSIAFAKTEELKGEYLSVSPDGFVTAMNVSVYTLTHLVREARSLLQATPSPYGSSVLTLTYLGGERVMPGYNVMGLAKAALDQSVQYLCHDLGPQKIRVNAISAGPVNTLAARGIHGFSQILDHVAAHAPMKRNIEAAEVGDTAAFLCSDLSRGITGEILHVDAGYHVMA